ncbi:hypothetical protein MNBD_ALPHA11-2017 [hydrothermal vent metagenome]|uniref:Uncharacterized protein n=1 Tax=hydrothermal vent metagenome TaxID=652676 RepID=A0A3B0TSX1_9ZZZZ
MIWCRQVYSLEKFVEKPSLHAILLSVKSGGGISVIVTSWPYFVRGPELPGPGRSEF